MQLGLYQLEPARLEGGQAYVHFAHHLHTGQRVAIKLERPNDGPGRIAREITTLRRLRHDNCVQLLEADPDRRWFAMPAAIMSLQDRAPFAAHELQQLRVGLLGVASCLRAAHALKLIHRDLHPGNVLIYPAGWAVCDWGLVHRPRRDRQPRRTQPLDFFGVPGFVAPEAWTHPREVLPGRDVFALGRIAGWALGIDHESPQPQDAMGHYWHELVVGASAPDRRMRWGLEQVLEHLATNLPGFGTTRPGDEEAPAVADRLWTPGARRAG